jgi:ankyrin repeat protein
MEDKLLEAACYGDIEAIRALIIAGAHIDAKNKMNGWTALHWAARRGQYESVKVGILFYRKFHFSRRK